MPLGSRAGRIRTGQEKGSQLQGNKGKPIPPGIILILETPGSPDIGSMCLFWEEKKEKGRGMKKEEGTRAGYCTKESVPHCVHVAPNTEEDLVTFSHVSVWMFWLIACEIPTKQVPFGTRIPTFRDTRLVRSSSHLWTYWLWSLGWTATTTCPHFPLLHFIPNQFVSPTIIRSLKCIVSIFLLTWNIFYLYHPNLLHTISISLFGYRFLGSDKKGRKEATYVTYISVAIW